MQVVCVKAFGLAKPGEIVSGLPDDAAVDPVHWRVVPPDPPLVPAKPAVLVPAVLTPVIPLKEG